MDIQGLIIFLAIGAAAGWLAGTLMKGGGFGLLGNIIVGIIGAVIGGFVFRTYLKIVLSGLRWSQAAQSRENSQHNIRIVLGVGVATESRKRTFPRASAVHSVAAGDRLAFWV